MRRRASGRGVEAWGLSFLDVVCCGFGAIVLLLVLAKGGEPRAIEQARVDLDGLVVRLEEELHDIRGRSDVLERDLRSVEEQLSAERERVARLLGDLSRVEGEARATREHSEVQDILEGRLEAARQSLTEEMRRLQRERPPPRAAEAPIGGIPVDSEYVIFVIDTSGSMQNRAWPLVEQKMQEVLDIYPGVKGLQVMNDMGQYMYSRYAGKWIPDTAARRKAILEQLRNWTVFSNSSPVEGIEEAIRTYGSYDRKVSVYVLGDEFTGRSITEVVDRVDRINRRDAEGRRLVRIHAIGFPTMFSTRGVPEQTGVRFATLMRLLCERHDGSFVGLPALR